MNLNDEQLNRYSRQIMLPQIDFAGQRRLVESTVLIMGAGGLASPVAMYLASAGVGKLIISDFDRVELSNLQRQIAYRTDDVGRYKLDAMVDCLQRLNPGVTVQPIKEKIKGKQLLAQVRRVQAVIDTTDNFSTRFAVNQACVQAKKPLISAAVIRMEGQISVFQNDMPDSPCYRCLYVDGEELEETCTQSGILAPVVGIIGSIQATETIKVLLRLGQTLKGRLLLLDAMRMEWRMLKLAKDPRCPVCGIPQGVAPI